jgi:hypothetical protein
MLVANTLRWFCHDAAHITIVSQEINYKKLFVGSNDQNGSYHPFFITHQAEKEYNK